MYLSQTNELWKFLENDGEKNANRGNDQIHLTGKNYHFTVALILCIIIGENSSTLSNNSWLLVDYF